MHYMNNRDPVLAIIAFVLFVLLLIGLLNGKTNAVKENYADDDYQIIGKIVEFE